MAAWGEPPPVYRCGIDDPGELTCSSELSVINGVSWLSIDDADSTTYIAVDRSSRVALTFDHSVGIGVVQALSDVIKTVLPAREVCMAGVVVPTDRP